MIHALFLLFFLLYPSFGVSGSASNNTKKYLEISAEGINAPLYPNGDAIAHKIVETGNIRGIQTLSKLGADMSLQNKRGESPFLLGYIHKIGLRAIQQMSNADPQAVLVRDKHGRTPLMTALKHGNPLDVIQYTYRLHPAALAIPDYEGRLPAHYLFRYSTDLGVKKFIIRMDPSALSVRDVRGGAPLDYAQKYKKKNSKSHTKIMRFINNLKRQTNGRKTMIKPPFSCQNSFGLYAK